MVILTTSEDEQVLVLRVNREDRDWKIDVIENGSSVVHTTITAHKSVLTHFSNMFKGIFSSSRFQENEEECSEMFFTIEQAEVLSSLINDYIYGGQIEVDKENFVCICHLIDYLQMHKFSTELLRKYEITTSNMMQHLHECLTIDSDGRSELFTQTDLLIHICKSVRTEYKTLTLDDLETYLTCCNNTQCTGFLDNEDIDVEEQMSTIMRGWLYHNGSKYNHERQRIQMLMSMYMKTPLDR
jgi:hypothetical protein